MKTLIVGGVAGGATVAARLRRLDENSEIIIFERGEHISYANCGLPYYIGDIIKRRESLLVQTKEGFKERLNIDVRNLSEVISIDKEKKEITIKDCKKNTIYTETYDKLVISTGAEPLLPNNIKGIDDKRIFTLRNISDMDSIKRQVTQGNSQKAVVIGGGFIGLEMVENLKAVGLEVTLIERNNQVMTPIDFTMASIVHNHLKNKGVELWFNENVTEFISINNSIQVNTAGGRSVVADLVILSIGVKPESQLAKNAGLEVKQSGLIGVDEYMQTSDPDIYALGDAVEIYNPVIKKWMGIPLAGPANKQGRIVANNILEGNKYKYAGTIGTAIAKVFDLSVASAGVSTKVLDRENIAYQYSITHGSSHATYYPGALPLSIQLIFSPENGIVLGAQIVGFDGVDKRIDLIAQVIKNGGTIYDLQAIEHAYAPPYSSAKDPVNIAGFVAENILTGKMKVKHWTAIETAQQSSDTILDVRTKAEYEMGHIEGAINIPVDDLRVRLTELKNHDSILVYCAVGYRGYVATRILMQNGFDKVYNLSGGYKTYSSIKQSNLPTKPKTLSKNVNMLSTTKDRLVIDACGLQCPGPIMELKKHYDRIPTGDTLEIKVTDQAFGADLQGWANMVGANVVSMDNKAGIIHAVVEKKKKAIPIADLNSSLSENKTLVVFSDDLDRALASFVIANGAAASGKKVSMFFTFWGLNVIKKTKKPKVKKDVLGKMFGFMLPSSSKKLSLSQMNMGGMGSRMMRYIMKSKKISSLEELITQAQENGIEMIACSMSMDVMGVKQEELFDNVTIGGVAAYLDRSDRANMNLFI